MDTTNIGTQADPEEATIGRTGIEETYVGTPLTLIADKNPETRKKSTFNSTNEMVDWAKWTWNPVTGCEHNCIYCYARTIQDAI